MKTLLALTFTLTLSVGYPTSADATTQVEHKSAAGFKVFWKRLSKAILPGLKRSSAKPYSYLTPPSHPNRFRAPFKGGRNRIYMNDVQSPLGIDSHMPDGNLFEFKF